MSGNADAFCHFDTSFSSSSSRVVVVVVVVVVK